MSDPSRPCRSFEHVDLAAYVIDPDASDWTTFREHFPTCEECTTALQSWSELEWNLGEIGVGLGSHPTIDELDRYAGGLRPAEAAPRASERTRIETHLSGCASCADEVRALERFVASGRAAAPTLPTVAAAADSFWTRAEHVLRGLGLGPVPALGLAAVALLLGWWIVSSGSVVPSEDVRPQMAETRDPDPGQGRDLEPAPRSQEAPESAPIPRIANVPEPVPAPRQGERPAPDATASQPPQLAVVDPEPEPGRSPRPLPQAIDPRPQVSPTPSPREPEAITGDPYEILLASLDLDPILAYHGQAGLSGAGRMDLIGRSGAAAATDAIQLVAPGNHAGRSGSTHPLLLWSLSQDAASAIEIQIVDERAIDPVLRLILEGPHRAGLHAIDLESRAIELERGVAYVWSASILVDADRPSRNPRSQATLVVAEMAPTLPADVTRGTLAAGYWYDGLGELARARAAMPESEAVGQAMSRLLSGEGLRVDAGAAVEIH